MARILALLVFAAGLHAQATDAVLTQTLITEIRALRQQLEATNVTAQRVQIALYRLQSQTAIVNTVQQRMDAAHTRLMETQNHRQALTARIQVCEQATSGQIDSSEKAAMQQELPQLKSQLEAVTIAEGTQRAAEADATAQFRNEQARLADLQSLLDRLDKALDELARPRQ